jgi:hypothetical protein
MKTFACLAGTVLLATTPALATEYGTQHYPVGINTVAAGNLPPPGMLQYLNYFQVVSMPTSRGPDGAAAVPDFNISVVTNAARFLYTWKSISVGSLNYSTGLVIPVVRLDLQVHGRSGRDFSVGDLNFQNYLSGANSDHSLFYRLGVDLAAPTGHYNKNDVVSVGLNYFSVTPNAAFTWMPSPTFEATGSLVTELNFANPATDYHSGNNVDLDYAFTVRPLASNRSLGLGVQGYFFKQVSDDTLSGVRVGPDGHRGQEFGFGPQLRYNIGFGGVVLKYQRTYAVRNRPSGDKMWLMFAAPLRTP